MLYELMRKIDPMLTSQTLTQSGIKDDSESYLNDFERRLFLDTDSPEINLKSMYVSPRIAENEDLFAADEIMKWYNNWDDYSPSTMFVFGDAGVGKSSLCAKMIHDAETNNTNDQKDFHIPKEKLHICRLRSHIRKIENNKDFYSIKDLIGLLFNINADEYEFDRDIFVLDGFDEFCVLTKNEKLIRHILDKIAGFSTNKFKILITSRKSKQYFLGRSNNATRLDLKWSYSCVEKWCENYESLVKSQEIKEWCRVFPEKYKNLSEDDNRREIFCIPIILYISANTEIDVEEHNSVGRIYDEAFRKIAHRSHGAKQEGMDNFNEDDEIRQRLINWQFTKEVAYQMFLNYTLYISDTRDSKLLDNAKNRTAKVLKDRGVSINKEDIEIPQYLAMFHFARHGNDGMGIEFAHKTVYEYFTAVKLYEDYFAEITEDYPENFKKQDAFGNKITPLENVWVNIIEAFRYKSIAEEDKVIFDYLSNMARPIYNGKAEDEGKGFNFETLVKYFVEGMEQQILSELPINKAVKEYKVKNSRLFEEGKLISQFDLLTTQISRAFCSLTWFLTERKNGFNNKDNNMACKRFRELVSINNSVLNLKNWKLSKAELFKADLTSANLFKANLSGADLSGAKLSGANLNGADLNDADLSRAKLRGAKLSDAKLGDAYLNDADLSGADLKAANLIEAKLEGAKLNGAKLNDAKLNGAKLSDAKLGDAVLNDADLSGADLREAELNGADLNEAKYCLDKRCETKFPEGFNPKEHGMIEVDYFGNPVK